MSDLLNDKGRKKLLGFWKYVKFALENECAKLPKNNDFKFSGGCLGCFNCASDGKCIYKDGFDKFLRENINTADAIICAAKIWIIILLSQEQRSDTIFMTSHKNKSEIS